MRLARNIVRHTRWLDHAIEAGRDLIGPRLPTFVFLFSYVLTMLLGNVLYFTSSGMAMVQELYPQFRPQDFQYFGSPGYWGLLLLPLLLVPATAILGCRIAKPAVEYMFRDDQFEINLTIYMVLSVLCHVYCVIVLYQQEIINLNLAAYDLFSSLHARFVILERVGFAFRIVVNAILPLLVIYSLVRAIQFKRMVWWCLFIANAVATSVYLILLNMKWPILVLWVMIFLATIVQSKRHHFFKGMLLIGLCILAYLTVSAFVLRLDTAPPSSSRTAVQYASVAHDSPRSDAAKSDSSVRLSAAADIQSSSKILGFVGEGLRNGAGLFIKLINRMASSYPVYYEEFTSNGFVCGTLWDRLLRRSVPCAPSTYLYRKTTPANDPFRDLGTLPVPVNVSGYALGGWLTAAIATGLAGIILGIFSAFGSEGRPSATRTTAWIMGAQIGYFFSQLPVEGPIVYDHGAFWWGGVLLLGAAASTGVDTFRCQQSSAQRTLWCPQRAIVTASAILFVILVLVALWFVSGVWNAFWPTEIRG